MAIFALAALPSVVLVADAFVEPADLGWSEILRRPFWSALLRSLYQMVVSGMVGMLVGWPYGTALGLFRFPLKWTCWLLLALPLLLPPFLWAIGLQSLKGYLSYGNQVWLDGFSGCALAHAVRLIPIVAVASALAAMQIKQGEMNAALLCGGAGSLWRQALRHGFPAAAGAGLLGSLLSLSDSGCGQIMGYHGAPGEILVAFSARNDFSLAALKSLVIAAAALPVAIASAILLARGLHVGVQGRGCIQAGLATSGNALDRVMLGIGMVAVSGILLLPAMFGLVKPLLVPPRASYLKDALDVLNESLAVTLHYGAVAGGVSAVLALAATLACRGSGFSIRTVFVASLVLFSMPASLHALGVVKIAAMSPPTLDQVFRSRSMVGISHALHMMPLGLILLSFPWTRLPRSILDVARLQGMRPLQIALRLALPVLGRPLLGVAALTGMLSLADVSSTILLQPPGDASFGTRLFAVMDNSMEKVVASLCLVYCLLPLGMMFLIVPWVRAVRRNPNHW